MQSFSRFVSTIWCWWREIGPIPGLTNSGEAWREGQGLNGFCWRIIIKHPHFRNTGLACCWLLPWKHKGSDLDTCFSIFKAFKPFHKPGEGVSLVVKISGSKRILSWVAKISQFWSSQFPQCSYPWPSSRQWLARCCQNFSSAPRSCSQLQLASLHQNCIAWEATLYGKCDITFCFQLNLQVLDYFPNFITSLQSFLLSRRLEKRCLLDKYKWEKCRKVNYFVSWKSFDECLICTIFSVTGHLQKRRFKNIF